MLSSMGGNCWAGGAGSSTLTELTARQRGVPEAVFVACGGVAAVDGVAEVAVEHDSVSVGVLDPVPAQQLPVLHAWMLAVNHCCRETPSLRELAVMLRRGG